MYPITRPLVRILTNKFKNKPKYIVKKPLIKGAVLLSSVPVVTNFIPNELYEKSDTVASICGVFRFFRSLSVGLWISVDYYFSMLGLNESNPNYHIMMSRIHDRAANSILNAALQNGGAYIKLGQGLVAMGHVLPKEYISTLKILLDKCLLRGSDELVRIFQKDFGKNPTELFKTFDDVPIAAASLAQVYKAETFDNEQVAVKVQYIDLQKRFLKDINTVTILLKIAGWMHPDFDFSWILDELKETLKQELDFLNEGKNSEKCAKDLEHLKYIHIPKVFWNYSNERVLVTEFIDGIKINDINELHKNGFSLSEVSTKLFEAFGYQIFQSGFVHADPHPGNILIRKKGNNAELVLLDHGLYQQISVDERKALSHMWKAMVLSNHSEMKKYSTILGVQDYEMFAEILAQAPLKTNKFKLKSKLTEEDIKVITEFARHRFDSIMNCLKDMPSSLLLVLRNLNTIRAICNEHGNPIDRYTVLARVAIKSTYEKGTFVQKVTTIPKDTYFEFKLFTYRFTRWLQDIFMKILINVGLVPDIKKYVKEIA